MIPLLSLALSAPAQAATAQALVELRPEGARLIDLVASPGPLSGRSLPPLKGAPLLELLDAEGAVLARLPLPDARGRSVLPLGAEMPGQEVVLDRTVLRVPLNWPDGAVALRLGAQRLSPRLPPPLDPIAVQDSGPSTERLDLVILGDGYGAAELDRFAEDVDRMSAYLLGIEPYGAYRDLFNIWRIDRASAESGVSHYDAGRDEDRDTAYGCCYGCAGIDRLVCCDDAKVMTEVAEAVPGADGVLVLINDPTYGGAGGYQYATSAHRRPHRRAGGRPRAGPQPGRPGRRV